MSTPETTPSKSERTRQRLRQAAAHLFAHTSFESVSTRAIAKEAGVDAALIHHYFGSKEGLFNAVLEEAIHLDAMEIEVTSSDRAQWGRTLIRAADKVWTSPAAPALKAVVRRALTGKGHVMRDFATKFLLERIISHLDGPEEERRLRASLAGSQMAGFVVARHIVGIEPIASLTTDEAAELIGPVLQHYLTGSLNTREPL